MIKSAITGAHAPILLPTRCVALGKWLTLSDLQFLHL